MSQVQLYVTKRDFCDFVVWSENQLHVERITLDDSIIARSIPPPIATKFWKMCVIPELMGKVYTVQRQSDPMLQSVAMPIEEDRGRWIWLDVITSRAKLCGFT